MTQALVIPAYNSKPPLLVDLGTNHLAALQEYVGGWVQRFAFDDDADTWMNEEGRINGFPLNRQVTAYNLTESSRARTGETQGNEEWFSVYGTVVITGPADDNGNITDVPQSLVDHFGPAPEQTPDFGL